MPVTAAKPDGATVARQLARLKTAYPAFDFSRKAFGRRGGRWVAERLDHSASGVSVVITNDLMELHTVLARDRDGRMR